MRPRTNQQQQEAQRRTGRPSALDDDFQMRLYLDALRRSGSRSLAASAIGISPKTVNSWIARAEGRLRDRRPTRLHVRFARQVRQIEAEVEVTVVARLFELSRTHVSAAKFLLTNRYPERWR